MAQMDGVVVALEVVRMVRFWVHLKVKPVGFPDEYDVGCEGMRVAS